MKKFKPLIIIILICGCTFFLCYFIDRYTRLENIEVTGGSYYSAGEIKELVVNDSLDSFTWVLYLRKQVFGSIGRVPFIEKIDIELVDRNSIRINVYDKVVSGCVKHMGKYMHFDRDGIVVESSSERMKDVPEITGVPFERVVLGEKLVVEDSTVFNHIMNLVLLLKKYEISCQEINFDLRNNVKIYFDGNIALLGSGDMFDEQLSCLNNLIKASDINRYTFDLRDYNPEVGEVSARLIEEEGEEQKK